MMEFQKFTWNLQRIMRHNRKPIILLFGNGYDSQIILMALHKLKKHFILVHVAEDKISSKILKVMSRFVGKNKVILRPHRIHNDYKTFYNDNAFCVEDLNNGFSSKDYLIIAGFKLSEPSLIKAFYRGDFDSLLCPLLRYTDGDIEVLYQDMKDTEKFGDFLFSNLTSDSHHNIVIQ